MAEGGKGFEDSYESGGYASGAEWDPVGILSDPEDDPGFEGLGTQESWSSAPTAVIQHKLMEGEIRKKPYGKEWQYGRLFRQWIPTPKIHNFKSSGTSISIWVPDTPRYEAVVVNPTITFRGFKLNEQNGQWSPAQAICRRQLMYYPPYNPAQAPNPVPQVQMRGAESILKYNRRIDYGGRPLNESDLLGLKSVQSHLPPSAMDMQEEQKVTKFRRPMGREVAPGMKEIERHHLPGSPFRALPEKTFSDGKFGYWFKMAFPTYEWQTEQYGGKRGEKVMAHADPCMVHVRHVDHPMDRPYYVTPRHTWAMVKGASGRETKMTLPNRVFRFYPPRMPGQGRESGRHHHSMTLTPEGYYLCEPDTGAPRPAGRVPTPIEKWNAENPDNVRGSHQRQQGHWEIIRYPPIKVTLEEPYQFKDRNNVVWTRLPTTDDPRHTITFEPKKMFFPDQFLYKWVTIDPPAKFVHFAHCAARDATGKVIVEQRTVFEPNSKKYQFKHFPVPQPGKVVYDRSMTDAEVHVAKHKSGYKRTFLLDWQGKYHSGYEPPAEKLYDDPGSHMMLRRKQMRKKSDSSALMKFAIMANAEKKVAARPPAPGYGRGGAAAAAASPSSSGSSRGSSPAGRSVDPLAPPPGTPAYDNYMKLFGSKGQRGAPAPVQRPPAPAPIQRPPGPIGPPQQQFGQMQIGGPQRPPFLQRPPGPQFHPQGGFPPRGGMQPPGGFPPPGAYQPPGGFPPPRQYQQQGGFPPRGGMQPPGGFMRPGQYQHHQPGQFHPQGGFPPRGGMQPPGGFPPPGAYQQQGGFQPRGGFPPQGGQRFQQQPPMGGGFQPRPQGQQQGRGAQGRGNWDRAGLFPHDKMPSTPPPGWRGRWPPN